VKSREWQSRWLRARQLLEVTVRELTDENSP